jgi:hypothetical protein
MSDYSGYDRPYPTWFPYFLVAILIICASTYFLSRESKLPASTQPQKDMSVARHKVSGFTNRRT